jgi:acetyltransferase-like isoleucine patch superfamily enzyme
MINPLAVIKSTQIGNNPRIDEYSIIKENVIIGNDVIIHPNVVIEPGVVIGDNVEVFPGAYIGKEPKGAGAIARPIQFDQVVEIGDNCSIGPNAVLYYDVKIGNNTLIGDGASIREQVRIGHHCLISRYVTINYNSSIGNFTKIMDMAHITGNVSIGDNVFISIMVSSANDNILIERTYDEEKIEGPLIEDDVSIGAGAILLPGVRIGKGSFIGAVAVVTKDVAPGLLVMGVPARPLRDISSAGSVTNP